MQLQQLELISVLFRGVTEDQISTIPLISVCHGALTLSAGDLGARGPLAFFLALALLVVQ
ncbi:MAG: hypothetical protein A2180_02845 [Pseudomonadales bacterium GWC2_63_15]|nr:MAG: hypothetical protein A2180_02845 [Pseudomonadales bacterium GWC2_63_15]